MKIDNTMVEDHQRCPSLYNLRHNHGWTSKYTSAALGIGGALHLGLAEWYRGKGLQAAIDAIEVGWPLGMPVDDYRTLTKAQEVMRAFVRKHPTEAWSVVGTPHMPLVEQVFTLPTGMYMPCDTCGLHPNNIAEAVEQLRTPGAENPWADGLCHRCATFMEPIEYGGVIDLIVNFGAKIFIVDHKTTAQMGSTYFLQFKPNNQISGYCWAAGELSGRRQDIGGGIINGIGIYKSSPTKFEREITSRTETNIREWLVNLWYQCLEMRMHEKQHYWPMRTKACTIYGTCPFYDVHSLASEDERRRMLEQNYVVNKWDWQRRDDV